jgi:hypothetical protein
MKKNMRESSRRLIRKCLSRKRIFMKNKSF